MPEKNKTAVLMGSASDLKVMKPAIKLLQEWKVFVEVKVVSAHRAPELCKNTLCKPLTGGSR